MNTKLTFGALAACAVAGAGVAVWIMAPKTVDAARFEALEGDPVAGKIAFAAGGCASCHIAEGADHSEELVLSGGQAFETQFGTFYAPNISPHPDAGTGDWTTAEMVNAVMAGVSPSGQHYYPAFPYTSYAKADPQDIVNIAAYIQTLPPSDIESRDHDVGFPFNIRYSLGGWKFLFGSDDWVIDGELTASETRGRELVEGLAHCAECHTPRNALGGLDKSQWMAGAPNPSGAGNIPNITPAALDWIAEDIAIYLESGFTPDFDTAGGEMAHVVENMAQLTADDRMAIADYLKRIPAIEN